MRTLVTFTMELENEFGECDEVTCEVEINGDREYRGHHPAYDPCVDSLVVKDSRGALVNTSVMQDETIIQRALKIWREQR